MWWLSVRTRTQQLHSDFRFGVVVDVAAAAAAPWVARMTAPRK
jgi:hypothetical protein